MSRGPPRDLFRAVKHLRIYLYALFDSGRRCGLAEYHITAMLRSHDTGKAEPICHNGCVEFRPEAHSQLLCCRLRIHTAWRFLVTVVLRLLRHSRSRNTGSLRTLCTIRPFSSCLHEKRRPRLHTLTPLANMKLLPLFLAILIIVASVDAKKKKKPKIYGDDGAAANVQAAQNCVVGTAAVASLWIYLS